MPVPTEVALDFSGVKPFEPLDPRPIYLAKVTGFKLGESKEKNPKASLELTIEGPGEVQVDEWEFGADGQAVKEIGPAVDAKSGKAIMTKASGRKLFREYSLIPTALPFLYEFIKAVDPTADLSANFVLDTRNYLGLDCAVRIQNEGYQEQVRARVQRVYPASKYTG